MIKYFVLGTLAALFLSTPAMAICDPCFDQSIYEQEADEAGTCLPEGPAQAIFSGLIRRRIVTSEILPKWSPNLQDALNRHTTSAWERYLGPIPPGDWCDNMLASSDQDISDSVRLNPSDGKTWATRLSETDWPFSTTFVSTWAISAPALYNWYQVGATFADGLPDIVNSVAISFEEVDTWPGSNPSGACYSDPLLGPPARKAIITLTYSVLEDPDPVPGECTDGGGGQFPTDPNALILAVN
jgi:hypothetical protein